MLKQRAAAGVAGALVDGLFRTVRYEIEGAHHHRQFTSKGKPVIFALWHGRLLPLAYLHRGQGVVTLISRSADGEYLARLLSHWGFDNVRGSSSRGGTEALRELVRRLRTGRSLAITPDGPRGPTQSMKPGVLVAARLAGVPIIPTTSAATAGWWPGRWDRFLIPKPFATVHVRYAEPYMIPRTADEGEILHRTTELEQILNGLTSELDRSVTSGK
ncbi:MAG: lysophospholipid acyltransferase family protein [Longimicrobiales bacterium]